MLNDVENRTSLYFPNGCHGITTCKFFCHLTVSRDLLTSSNFQFVLLKKVTMWLVLLESGCATHKDSNVVSVAIWKNRSCAEIAFHIVAKMLFV